MQYRRLGRTDISVSVVCMGCWAVADPVTWGPQDESDAIEAIGASLDAGVNFFDSAENYGQGYSEELLGRALVGRRAQAVIGTKVGRQHQRTDELVAACERSLARLQTDYIDLYMLHWPNHELGFDEPMAAMERLRSAGKVRAVGVSNFARRDLPDVLSSGRVEVDQLPYSLLWRAVEFDVLPICRANQVSVTCYSPLMQGLLAGKFRSPDEVPAERARTRHFRADRPKARHGEPGHEALTFETIERIGLIARAAGVAMSRLALAWLLAQPAVASVVVGARDARQARDNAAAGSLTVPPDVLAELTDATEPLRQALGGDNPDMWQSPSRMR